MVIFRAIINKSSLFFRQKPSNSIKFHQKLSNPITFQGFTICDSTFALKLKTRTNTDKRGQIQTNPDKSGHFLMNFTLR